MMRDTINRITIVSESSVAEEWRAKGWHVYKPSWPHFLLLHPDGRVLLLDVKRQGERVGSNQAKTHALLRRVGFEVKVGYPSKRGSHSISLRDIQELSDEMKRRVKS